MDKQLTAGQALAQAAEWMAEAEKWTIGDDAYPIAMQAAHAYSTYALAMVAWDGTLDVRARVESGI